MSRALSLTCTALVLIGLSGSQALAGKPSIAVLGLEVVDQSGTPTPAASSPSQMAIRRSIFASMMNPAAS